MTVKVTKLASVAQAHAYYTEADDYYLAGKDEAQSAARWYGAGVTRAGLAGAIDAAEFRDVLDGKIAGQQVGRAGEREVTLANGELRRIPNHTPGWDVTMSAPKSISVAALVHGDRRLIAVHDAAVDAALSAAERHAVVTRQRAADGSYVWRRTEGLVAGVVRHASSRDLDPQLHSHAVVANATFDPVSGRWVSLDSRDLFAAQRELGNVYAAALAQGARRLGYDVEWSIDERGNATVELAEITVAERDLFSSRSKAITEELAAHGMEKSTASAKARDAAALATRTEKQHVPAAELSARWVAQAEAAGFRFDHDAPARKRIDPAQRLAAGRDAVAQAIEQVGERQTRFTERQLEAEATLYAQGKADHDDLAKAIREAHESGVLIDRSVAARSRTGEQERVAGYTTAAAKNTELDMLARADSITARSGVVARNIDALIATRERKNGHAFTDEHRAATHAILSGGGFHIVQGFAGSAKTSSVLAAVADACRAEGLKVRAIAPTHSAADTLGRAIDADAATVAATIQRRLPVDTRTGKELWIVDEAGMIAARDMHRLLTKADRAQATVVMVGDTHQLSSVGAGAAFAQLQAARPESVHRLTNIKRQSNEQMLAAVYATYRGKFGEALDRVTVTETGADRDAAVAALAGRYMMASAGGKDTFVVTLSRADRADVNAEVQRRREADGQVRDARTVVVLRSRGLTAAERRDASRYQVGDVIESPRTYRHGPEKGELVRVAGVADGKVTTERADGSAWTFRPEKVKSAMEVYQSAEVRVGVGEKIIAKGTFRAAAVLEERVEDTGASGEPKKVRVKNNTELTVEAIDANTGAMTARMRDGQRVQIDAAQGAKIDLAYARTADAAQGAEAEAGAAWLRSTQQHLADQQHALTAISRFRDDVLIVTDDRAALAETLENSREGKEAAAELARQSVVQAKSAAAASADDAQPSREAGQVVQEAWEAERAEYERERKQADRLTQEAWEARQTAREAGQPEAMANHRLPLHAQGAAVADTVQAIDRRAAAEARTRPATRRAREAVADTLAALRNRIAADHARRSATARAKSEKKWARSDRQWLRKGHQIAGKIRANADRAERNIRRATGTRMGSDIIGLFMESSRQNKGRWQVRAVERRRDAALEKIERSMAAAFERAVRREVRAGATEKVARRKVTIRTIADRHISLRVAGVLLAAVKVTTKPIVKALTPVNKTKPAVKGLKHKDNGAEMG